MMDMAVRETLCTRCTHLKVCRYMEDMEIARVQVDRLRVDTVEPITITVSCNMYHQNNGNIR